MLQMKNYKNLLKSIIPWLLIVGVMYVMTVLNMPLIIKNTVFVLGTSICLFRLWKNSGESKIEVILIMVGFFLRIVVCLIDVYGAELLTVPFSGDDSMNFYNTSVAYYHGDFSRVYTKIFI